MPTSLTSECIILHCIPTAFAAIYRLQIKKHYILGIRGGQFLLRYSCDISLHRFAQKFHS